MIDAILSQKFSNQTQPASVSKGNSKVYPSVEVEPIYFDPISYDSMSTYSTAGKSSSSSSIYKDSIAPLTFPSALASEQYSGSPTRNNKNGETKTNSSSRLENSEGQIYAQTSTYKSYDYLENSIPPLNVYETTP